MASSSYTYLCSSPPLPARLPRSPKQTPSLCCLLKLNHTTPFLTTSTTPCNSNLVKPSIFIVNASDTQPQTSKSDKDPEGEEEEEEKFEVYEVEIIQPYGLKFAKGRDGGTYIDAIAPGGFADKTGKFTVGDRVLATRYTVRNAFFLCSSSRLVQPNSHFDPMELGNFLFITVQCLEMRYGQLLNMEEQCIPLDKESAHCS